MKSFLFFFLSFLFISSAFTQTNKANGLVSKMTLDKKVNLVVGTGMNIPGLTQNSGPIVGQTKPAISPAIKNDCLLVIKSPSVAAEAFV